MASSELDVIVIGAGPAGTLAAAEAAELGASTALVSSKELGGMAANDGPVPVRSLAYTARLLRDARQLDEYGVSVSSPVLDYPRMLKRVETVVEQVRNSSSFRQQIESNGGIIYENSGIARFADPHTIVTDSGLRLSAGRFILATGGVSKKLPIPGFEYTSTHSDAWRLRSVPSSIIIVGSGATGVQVASIFNAFGSKIYLFEVGPHMLPAEDDEVGAAVAEAFRNLGISVYEDFGSIDSFEKTSSGVRMNYTKKDGGQSESIEAPLVVTAVGWGADAGGIGLDVAGVDLTQRGFIKVDEYLQTSASHIFAAGDVIGHVMLASEALRDGYIAATNAVNGRTLPLAEHAVAAGSFTDPEYASIGLTEKKARADHDVVVAKAYFATNPRAIIDDRTFGFCKLVVDRKSSEILGCQVVGERAIEIIQIVSVALGGGMRRVDALASASVSFPTYAEILVHAAVNASRDLGLKVGGWQGRD